MRERVAGRIRVKAGDLEILQRLIEVAQSNPYHGGKTIIVAPERSEQSSAELRMFRVAVRRMCRECVDADTDEAAKQIGCPDRQCPLRDVSPLSMCSNPIQPGDW
jgi:cob(I)alamin adenosyltransferase